MFSNTNNLSTKKEDSAKKNPAEVAAKYVLKASQDAKRAIKYVRGSNEGRFVIYDIENPDDIRPIKENNSSEIEVGPNGKPRDLVECAFFPSAFGVVIALGYSDGNLKFITEKSGNEYDNIDFHVGGPDNEAESNFELKVPPFEKNLRISHFPPELNIGFISNGIICIFYVDFQTSLIKLIPIRRYDAPNTVWFDFTNNYSIWRCAINGEKLNLAKFNLNEFEPKPYLDIGTEKKYILNDFVDAAISPVQFNGTEKIAILNRDGHVNIISNNFINNQHDNNIIKTEVKNPLSIEWSPFGARIAIFSNDNPKILIEKSSDSWISIDIKY